MSAAQGAAAMAALYAVASSVASAAVPPAAITTDANIGAYYGIAPPQQFNPQFFIAITGVEGAKQTPHYIGAGRVEEFELAGVVWGAVTDATPSNLESLSNFLMSLVDSVGAVVDSDPTLSGTAYQSWLASYDLTFDVETNGRAIQIDFAIHVDTQVS